MICLFCEKEVLTEAEVCFFCRKEYIFIKKKYKNSLKGLTYRDGVSEYIINPTSNNDKYKKGIYLLQDEKVTQHCKKIYSFPFVPKPLDSIIDGLFEDLENINLKEI